MNLRMPSINLVEISGNIATDIELKYTPSGKAVLRFNIAHTRNVKAGSGWEKDTKFYKVVIWDKAAESLAKSVAKGSPVIVQGRIDLTTYKKEDVEVVSVEITAYTVHVLGWAEKEEQPNTLPHNNDNVPEPF